MSVVPDPLVRASLEEILKIAPAGPDPIRIGALSLLSCVPPYAHDMKRSSELSAEALTLARQLGRPSSLSEALRARLHSLSGPDDIEALLEVAAEMLERSKETRSWVPIEAHGARFGAMVLRGDMPAADTALRELGRVATSLRWPEAVWYHDRLQAQRRLLDGDFAEAESAGDELRARSKRMGLSYGSAFIDSQRNVLNFIRLGPVRASANWRVSVAQMFAASGGLQASYRAALVRLATDVGQMDVARRMFEDVVARDFEDVPKDIAYPNALHNLGIAATRFSDRPRVERLYGMLLPYARFNTPNNMLFYEGSASHALAVMAAELGRHEDAEGHFEEALAMNERMGTRPHLARTYFIYAQYRASREGKASQARARELASKGLELADALGMVGLQPQLRALLPGV
jgi:tetratricopeptide (TPR) repeat protein